MAFRWTAVFRRADDETPTDREAQGAHDAHRLLDDATAVREGDDPDEGAVPARAGDDETLLRDREVRDEGDPARAGAPLLGGDARFTDQRVRLLHGPRAGRRDSPSSRDGEVQRDRGIPDEPA